MQKKRLGTTDLNVSPLCLGTMTFGEQNSEDEAHAQLDHAVGAGLNFFDTSEMYPIPPRQPTYGLTEQYIGTWLKGRGGRDKLVIASKAANNVSNNGRTFGYIRDGAPRYDAANLTQAVDDSLKRLQTDYLDIYQLHWPERPVNIFGQAEYVHQSDEPALTPLHETLAALADLVKKGKIRYLGVSNETPWGLMTFLKAAELHGLPRIATIQNVYHLLNRLFEVGCAEVCHRENVALLGYSPLAFGALTGKYLDGQKPAKARMTLFPDRYGRFLQPMVQETIRQYVEIAQANNLTPEQFAIAFAMQRPFMGAPIIGATTLDQLKSNLTATEVTLSPDVLKEIEQIHRLQPNPCP